MKWIATYGSVNSGIKTEAEAKAWAAHQLGQAKPGAGTKAFLCEVKEQVVLTTPSFETIPYTPELVAPKTNGTERHVDF